MKLERNIGLLGGVGIVVGGVIGVGVFVFIPSIAANTAGAIWLAILGALAISLLGVLPIIQLSSALPIAGGGYLWCGRLLSPLWGTLVSNWALFGGSCSVAVVTVAMASYLNTYFDPGISVHVLSMIIIGIFYLIFRMGLKLQMTFQVILSAQMIGALILYFFVVGLGTPGNFTMSTNVNEGFALGLAMAFNVCFGFQIIAEMGEEMKHPGRNIPLALLIGSTTIFLIYVGASMAYLKVAGGDSVTTDTLTNYLNAPNPAHPPFIRTAAETSGNFMVGMLLLAAIGAGLTSLNAGIVALPRELFTQARDGALPTYFSVINKRTKTPLRASTLFIGVVFLIMIIGQVVDSLGYIGPNQAFKKVTDFYGLMTVYGILLMTIFASVASFRLPSVFPEQYKNAYFRMPPWLLYIVATLSIVSSVGLLALVFFTDTKVVLFIFIGITALIVLYYFLRVNYLKKQGKQLGSTFNLLDGKHHDVPGSSVL